MKTKERGSIVRKNVMKITAASMRNLTDNISL